MANYDIIKNNCNNFTDECCQFLIGKGLPDYIIKLPQEILSTPIGQIIRPIINNAQNKVIE